MIWNFPVWLIMCLFGWIMEMNSSTHKAHAYGLFKAYHFMCIFRWFLEMKPSSHRAHSYEFSLVWIFICSFLRWVPGHTEHRDMDCPQAWLFMCLCILFQEMKYLPLSPLILILHRMTRHVFLHVEAEFESTVTQNTLVFKIDGITLQVVPGY